MAKKRIQHGVTKHAEEMLRNLLAWERKPVLRKIYQSFYRLIAQYLALSVKGQIVEVGSGVYSIAEIIPGAVRTDLFPNPWISRIENAYALSFADRSVSNLVLFDVFHHLRYPGTALDEFRRVLAPHGRVLIFEPCISVLGALVFGVFHHEPLGLTEPIQWSAPPGWRPADVDYYAAQANATRIFGGDRFSSELLQWSIVQTIRCSSISYVASGGYSKPQFYPDMLFSLMQRLDRIFDTMPDIFATRLLVVLEKSEERHR